MVRLLSSTLIGVLVALIGLAPARAQLLVVTAGESQGVSRTLRVDTGMAVSGAGLTLPGAINAAALMPLESAVPARLTASLSDGSSLQITGNLEHFPDQLPRQVLRNTAGEGLLNASSLPASASSISVSTSVPAITALGASQAVITSTTVRLDLLTVFP